MSSTSKKAAALADYASKAVDGGVAEIEQHIGRAMTEAQKAAFVDAVVARVKREMATPADAIANAVLAKIASKAAIVRRERVIVLDTTRARTARKMLQHG